MQKSAKIALVAVFVVVFGGGAAFWFFFLRDDAPEKANTNFTSGVTTAPGATVPSSADGVWTVAKGNEAVFAGYRILELFGGETVKKTAAGRTSNVTATFAVAGTTVDKIDVTVDMTTLKSDRPPRDNMIRGQGLQTDTFKTATFKSTAPVTLPAKPELNKSVEVAVKGDLTLHGVTKPAELKVSATWEGAAIKLSGSAPVVLADYGITKLDIGPVTIDDHGDLEFQLVMVKG